MIGSSSSTVSPTVCRRGVAKRNDRVPEVEDHRIDAELAPRIVAPVQSLRRIMPACLRQSKSRDAARKLQEQLWISILFCLRVYQGLSR